MKREKEIISIIDTIEVCQSEIKFNRLIDDLYSKISFFETEKRKKYKKINEEVFKKQRAALHLDN